MNMQFRFLGVGYRPFWREAALSASSGYHLHPVYNTRDYSRTKVWRTERFSDPEPYMDADFGVDEPKADCVAVINHNLSLSGRVYVKASNVAVGGSELLDEEFDAWDGLDGWGESPWGEFPWGGPSWGVGDKSAGPVAIHYFSQAVSARYWRVGLLDPDHTGQHLQVGHVILDRFWAPAMDFSWQHTIRINDPSVTQESIGGQSYVNERMRQGELVFEFSRIAPDDVYEGFLEVFRCCGKVRPFVVDPIYGDADLKRRRYYRMYARFAAQPEIRPGALWRAAAPIRLIEAL